MASVSDPAVNERARHFLKVLVERYIREGQPVGSRTLARDTDLEFSPATIRNVMADLEDLGLVHSPHTSAGRVPTVSGYRFFVDFLITLKPPDARKVEPMKTSIVSEVEPRAVAEAASLALSSLTEMAGLVMVPRRDRAIFRQMEFLRLSDTRVLVILVTSDGEVQNRVIDTRVKYSEKELVEAANFLNFNYSGLDLRQMHEHLVEEMRRMRRDMDAIMARALEMAGRVLDGHESDEDFVMSGQTNLMGFTELAEMESLRQLFDSFSEKRQILHLLDRSMKADGIQLFIGEESGYEPFESVSLVTSPYEVDGDVAGVLGVVGPTRMAYDKVIPVVDVTARLLSSALNQR
ncbi:MAG: heat-inducible transcriptional repressor HrcA [Pseudomonadota bacterium]